MIKFTIIYQFTKPENKSNKYYLYFPMLYISHLSDFAFKWRLKSTNRTKPDMFNEIRKAN